MKEKILALLLAKFAGVRKDGLAQLSRTLEMQATTEAEAQALIDKLSVEKVTDFVKEWRAEVDKEVTTGVTSHEKKLKDKFNFVEKTTDPNPPTPPTDPKEKDEVPAWAKKLIEDNNQLKTKLASFESGKTGESRRKILTDKLSNELYKDIPQKTKDRILKDFDRMSFQKDEDFESYLTETETDIAAINQELADKGLGQQGRPFFSQQTGDGTKSAESLAESRNKGTSAGVTGKAI